MKKAVVAVMVTMALIFSTGVCGATLVTVGSGGIVSVDQQHYNLTASAAEGGLMWEADAAGQFKACICSMLSFRALQAIGQHLGITDFTSAQIQITTGWNTDGPERIFVENLGWQEGTGFLYADPLADASQQTLDDVWFTFAIDGMGTYKVSAVADNYEIIADTAHAGYREGWNFFDYRTYAQTTPSTDAVKNYFQTVVRGQIVENYTAGAAFEVAPVPEPGTLLTFSAGLVLLAGIYRRSGSGGQAVGGTPVAAPKGIRA